MAGTYAKVTQAQLAKELRVSPQAVNKLVKRGVLACDESGLIDLELARVAIRARVRPSSKTAQSVNGDGAGATTSGDGSAPSGNKYYESKAMREAEEARMAKLRREEMERQLIRVDAVRSQAASILAATRDALLQLPARLATALAAESASERVYALLDAEIHQALSQFATLPGEIGAAAPKDVA